jgi:hypothetical protein
VVTIDQTWEQNVTAEVEHPIGGAGQLGRGANLLDDTIAREKARVLQFAALPVHGHDHVCILREESRHGVSSLLWQLLNVN